MDNRSPDIVSRSRALRICYSGYRLTDSLFTTASGQRELLIGDRQVGKSTLSLGFVLSQLMYSADSYRLRNTVGVLAVVSSKCSTVVRAYELLRRSGGLSYIVVV